MSKAGLIKSLFVGRGFDSIPAAERIVSRTGAIDLPKRPFGEGDLTGAIKDKVLEFAVGKKPFTATAQRMRQGGLFGEGGVMRAPFARPAAFDRTLEERGLKDAILEHPGSIAWNTLKRGVGVGIPAMGVMKSFQDSEPSQLVDVAKDALTWPVATSFGMIGGPIAYKGITHASDLGMQFLRQRAPEKVQQFKAKYPDELYNF